MAMQPGKRKRALAYKPGRSGAAQSFHFFASSIAEWLTSEDPEKLIRDMKANGYDFNLYYVPLPQASEYTISNYSPVVKGAVFLGYWGFNEE